MNKPELLYLDLMKKVLSFTLWPEPPREIRPDEHRFLRKPISIITKILRTRNLVISRKSTVTETGRQEGMLWPAYAIR